MYFNTKPMEYQFTELFSIQFQMFHWIPGGLQLAEDIQIMQSGLYNIGKKHTAKQPEEKIELRNTAKYLHLIFESTLIL